MITIPSITEPIEISFALENTIKPSITFEDIHLLWEFTSENGDIFTNKNLFKTDVDADGKYWIFIFFTANW